MNRPPQNAPIAAATALVVMLIAFTMLVQSGFDRTGSTASPFPPESSSEHGASATPSDPGHSQLPSPEASATPSDAPASEFATAFADHGWVAIDPSSGDWIVGVGAAAIAQAPLGRGLARSNWATAAFTSDAGLQTEAGLIDRAGEMGAWPIDVDIQTAKARVNPDGSSLYVHAGRGGEDAGVFAIGTSDGETQAIVPAGSIEPGFERNFLSWSTTGKTLMSTLCDSINCQVDLIDDPTGVSTRLGEAFPALLVTDLYVFGRLEPGQPWLAWDIARGESITLAVDPGIESRVQLAIDNEFVLLDSLTAESYQVIRVPLDGSDSVVVFEHSDPLGNGLQLMRESILAGRWALMSDVASISDKLAEDGVFPIVTGLDLSTGTLEADPIQLSANDLQR